MIMTIEIVATFAYKEENRGILPIKVRCIMNL